MGQSNCRWAKLDQNRIQIPRGYLLQQGLLSEFEYPEINQEIKDSNNNGKKDYLMASSYPQTTNLPPKYLDLYMQLKQNNIKFTDTYFPKQQNPKKWLRLSQIQPLNKSEQHVTNPQQYQYKYEYNKQNTNMSQYKKTSKLISILQFIIKTYPQLVSHIKPVYIQKIGLAICRLCINGVKTDIIVDDFLPKEKIGCCCNVEIWGLLLEKAMVKVTGKYQYAQEFGVGELFCQITGIPYCFVNDSINSLENIVNHSQISIPQNFRQALKCDELLAKTKRFHQDNSVLGYRKNYNINSISFECYQNRCTILKLQIMPQQRSNKNKQVPISIRLVQFLKKYTEKSLKKNKSNSNEQNSYDDIIFEIYQQKQQQQHNQNKMIKYKRIDGLFRVNNCLYVQQVFTQLQPGIYWIMVRQFKQAQRLSIVTYSQVQVKLSQNFNINSEQFAPIFSNISSLNNQLITSMIQNIRPQINYKYFIQNNKIFLKFTENHSNKILYLNDKFKNKSHKNHNQSATIKNNYIMITEDSPKQYKYIDISQIKDKWIAIVCDWNFEKQISINQKIVDSFLQITNK